MRDRYRKKSLELSLSFFGTALLAAGDAYLSGEYSYAALNANNIAAEAWWGGLSGLSTIISLGTLTTAVYLARS